MENLQHWLLERQSVYSFLGILYQGDLNTELDILQNAQLLQQFAENFDNGSIHHAAIQILQEMHEHTNKAIYEKLLLEDYRRLFEGPGHLLAPPWESVYRTKEKLLFGDPDRSVRQFYLAFGLAVNPAEPADHLALELAFMARLCDLPNDDFQQISEILNRQRVFLEDHLLKWIPAWSQDVSGSAQTKYWSGLATLTLGWLENDLTELKEILEYDGGRK